jgi:hypothetical protein
MKLYDYSSKEEAVKHINEIRGKGWKPKLQDDGGYIYNNGGDKLPFSVEFTKGH